MASRIKFRSGEPGPAELGRRVKTEKPWET
jgi:hypothetical protein